MTKIDEQEGQTILDFILERVDSLLCYPEGAPREEVRELARATMKMLEAHHVSTGGYLGMVAIQYAAASFNIHAGPAVAAGFLRQIGGWLNAQSDLLANPEIEH